MMQAAASEGSGGSSSTSSSSDPSLPLLPQRSPASADEKKLIEVLLAAPTDARLVALLQCVTAWQCEGLANLQCWSRVLERLEKVLTDARETCPRLLAVAPATDVTPATTTDTAGLTDSERELTTHVYEVLRFSALLLQNASNKHAYKSIECVSAFLGARNDRIVLEATRVLAMLSLAPPAYRHTNILTSMSTPALTRSSALRRKLLTVAQSRSAATSSLDIVDLLLPTADAAAVAPAAAPCTFQFVRPHADESKTESDDSDSGAQVVTIAIPACAVGDDGVDAASNDESLLAESAYAAARVLDDLVTRYGVPARLHFELYAKIRAVLAVRSRATREALVLERLFAHLALFSAFSEAWDVTSYMEQNPELTRAVAELVRVELFDTVPVRVRVAALQVLAALVHDRGGRRGSGGVLGRQSNVLTALGVVKGTPHGVFPALVRFCMAELVGIAPASSPASAVESDSDMDMSLAVAFVHATTDQQLAPHEAEAVAKPAFRTASGSALEAKLTWIEAVLGLLTAVVGIQLGAAVLTENGVVPALLHVVSVSSTSALHAVVTTQCIQALEMTVCGHTAAATLYRDLNGVGILIDRLQLECASVSTHTGAAPLAPTKVVLLMALLEALSASFHAQGVMSAGATSRVIRDGSALSKVLVSVFTHVDVFGSTVFAQAAILVSDIINNDPSSVNHVHAGRIADAFLHTLTRWDVEALYPTAAIAPPCSELIMAVPSLLNALCLTSAHAERVAKHEPLMHLIDMFALPMYASAGAADSDDDYSDSYGCIEAEVASVVGGGVFELMRHLSSFQTAAIQACVHAVHKVARFGDEYVKAAHDASAYTTFLNMAANLADVLEPILSKSEYAVVFADQGGVAALFKMYERILPTTTSFLSSALAPDGGATRATTHRMSHHPTAQSITLALRAYAAQQPTLMLSALVTELNSQLDALQRARAVVGLQWQHRESSEGAEGVLCALPDVELAELFGDHGVGRSASADKLASVGEYLRVLSTIEWLSSLLVWTLQTAQSHLQSRRWFTEFAHKTTQAVLARLFTVDRSVQFERASLAALHRTQQQTQAQPQSDAVTAAAAVATTSEPMEIEPTTTTSSASSANHASVLWKVGSLLLLRFTIVMRSLLTAFGKALLTTPLHHRRGDDSAIPLAPHAATLADTITHVLEAHMMYMIERTPHVDAFVRQYYLTFVLETVVGVVFDGKRKHANTLLLVQLLQPLCARTSATTASSTSSSDTVDVVMATDASLSLASTESSTAATTQRSSESRDIVASNATCLLQVVMDVAEQFFARCLDSAAASAPLSRMDLMSFRVAAVVLRRFSDLESISASPLTAALTANELASDAVELRVRFKPRALSVQLHQLCLNVLLSVWRHVSFAALPVDSCIAELLPIVVTVLKTRLDQVEPAAGTGSAGSDAGDLDVLAGLRRHGGGGFGFGRGSFDDDSLSLRHALFGGSSSAASSRRSGGSRHAFVPDANIVESLTAMGFPRARVEHALRRIQINDVELAMEWILSHPDDDGDDNDDGDGEGDGHDDAPDGSETSDASESRSREDAAEKQRETELFAAYTTLRDHFESGCLDVLRAHATDSRDMVTPMPTATTVYPQQQLVQSIAEFFADMCDRSDDERETVVSRVNAAIVALFATADGSPTSSTAARAVDEPFYTMTTHLLALVLQLQPKARDVLLRQTPSCVEHLLTRVTQHASQALHSDAALSVSIAPVLLTLDALADCSAPTSDDSMSVKSETAAATAGSSCSLPADFQPQLVDVCLQLLTVLTRAPTATSTTADDSTSSDELHATIAHAVLQLLARVTQRYELASAFLARGGIDMVLNLRAACVFAGYTDLMCTLLSQVLESPEVLQTMMEDRIRRTLFKLSARLGSPSQMRITPRALLMELAPVAARNEDVFVKALESAVQVKKSESGRTYVVPKERASSASSESMTPAATSSDAPIESESQATATTTAVNDNDAATPTTRPATASSSSKDKDRKKTTAAAAGTSHKVPKSHKQSVNAIAHKLMDKIRAVWVDEARALRDPQQRARDLAARSESTARPVVCVGMYIELLVHVVMSFPVCAAVVAKASDSKSTASMSFLRLLLSEFLPSTELCRFAAQRRSLKDSGLYGTTTGLGSAADLPVAAEPVFLSVQVKERVQSSHRLLHAIVDESHEGAKCVVSELIHLLSAWLDAYRPTSPASGACDRVADGSVRDDESLAALHAWAGLIMTIAWPNGSSKGFAWDKVGPASPHGGQHAFVALLVEALRAVDLTHPLAHVTCSMLLRPLATLTRSFVTDRVRRSHRKHSSSAAGASGSADASPDNATSTPSSAVATADAAASGVYTDAPSEPTSTVSPRAGAALPSGSASTESELPTATNATVSMSASAEDVTMRTPTPSADDHEMRDVDDANLSTIDALDEVDEDDYSYLHILDDEALFVDEQHRRAQLAAREQAATTSSAARSGSDAAIHSLLDAFMGGSNNNSDTAGVGVSGGRASAARAGVIESEEYPFDLPSSDLFRDSVLTPQSHERQSTGVFQNTVHQFIDGVSDSGIDDVLFESFDMGGSAAARARTTSNRVATRLDAAATHPLLRTSSATALSGDSGAGMRIPARLSLPRHSSLLRELQELSEHVQTQLPGGFGGGAARVRTGMPRGVSGGSRHRPPSRSSRLTAVSNLLSEFSLDIPTSSHLSLSHARSHRLGHRAGRADHDIFGSGASNRGLRVDGGGASSAAIWGLGRDVDVRSVASRLEQRINEMVVVDDAHTTSRSASARSGSGSAATPSAAAAAPSRSTAAAGASADTSAAAGAASTSTESHVESDALHEQAAGNDQASETASVIALASTFGESTIRSPDEHDGDQTGSEAETPASPMVHDDERVSVESAASADAAAATSQPPPTSLSGAPAPTGAASASDTGSMLSFTLDLSGLALPPPPPRTTTTTAPPPAAVVAETASASMSEPRNTRNDDESKSEEAAASAPATAPTMTETETAAPPLEAATELAADDSTELQCPDGIDPEVFASLPPDMQAEIVAQSAPPPSSSTSAAASASGSASFSQLDLDMANSSFDRETLEALPADIRAEVLANERREREALAAAQDAPADISRAQEMDNASFVASLAPELREEILITCDDAFLQTLSSQVRAEAMVLRERAAFRTTYRERTPATHRTTTGTGVRAGNDDGISDLFQRPTLRRMLTSHVTDGLVGGTSRRTSRRSGHDTGTSRHRSSRRDGGASGSSDSSAHAGMLRVDRDEHEVADERVVDDACVRALLRLLFLAQSVIQNRVLQRVLTNLCVYPHTRASVREHALRVVTRALAQPLVPLAADGDIDGFPPTQLIESAGAVATSSSAFDADVPSRAAAAPPTTAALPAEVLTRMLHVLVALAKYNPRFAVELLRAHGMRRAGDSNATMPIASTGSDESGAIVLVELLAVPSVTRNGANLDTLLELLELVLSPLDRLSLSRAATATASTASASTAATTSATASTTAAGDAEDEHKASDDLDATAAAARAKVDEAEWVVVPAVELDAAHMQRVVSVLCMDICTSQMQERTVAILRLLTRVPANRARVVDAVVHHASRLARATKCALPASSSTAASSNNNNAAVAFESSAVLQSAQDELRLLRLLRTLSDLCDATSVFTAHCHAIGLDPLWDELSRSLEDARARGGLDEKESVSDSATTSTTTAAATTTSETAVAAAATGSATTDDDTSDNMVIEGKSAGASCAMAALLARFLPMVEAFFVVNARDAASMALQVPDSAEREEAVVANLRVSGFASAGTTTTTDSDTNDPTAAAASRTVTSPRALAAPTESSESMRLANFVEANRVLLNILVREKPSLLDTSLAALIKLARCRAYVDFDNKRTYFQTAMKKLRQSALRAHGSGGASSVRIPVRRDHIFEDSYYALRMRSGPELRRKLHISFTGEEGIDAGGVTREWYMILAREMFNPNYVLFTSAADSPTFQPNPLSYVNKDHLSYFEFVGKVLGKAVADGQLLDAHFTRSFYKHMLQLPISYHDMEAIDPEYYRNLHALLDHAIEDLGLELTFSAEQSNFGKLEVADLIPNGRHVAVTDANKMEYVKLVTHHRMATGIRQQLDAFLKGFHQLVPADMIAIFNENELELLISGMPEIDIDDLKANTDYANFKPTDAVIRWFWNVLYTFTHEERALFLQFVTGTSKVPLEGFKALEGMRGTQKFNIHKAYGNTSALPSAHTCFNQLDLPEYESEEKLKRLLLFAIREGSEGFGFG